MSIMLSPQDCKSRALIVLPTARAAAHREAAYALTQHATGSPGHKTHHMFVQPVVCRALCLQQGLDGVLVKARRQAFGAQLAGEGRRQQEFLACKHTG